MNDLIRKAVELADGWRINKMGNIQAPCVHRSSIDRPLKPVLDALAAQLVRQVDATAFYYVVTGPSRSAVVEGASSKNVIGLCEAQDRTLNTLKAIVESGVLDVSKNPKE